MMGKRIVSFILVLVLMISMLPMSAYAEETADISTVDGDVTVAGTNGFGTLLSNEITAYQTASAEEESEYTSGYSITDLVIEGRTATVTYDTMEEATLVVALYTEDGMQMLNSGTATVLPDATEATVTIEGDIPQYFMASAFLLDVYDMSPLCASYDTPMYTQEMQELLASTVNDYDPAKVLNLDEDETSNFAVYADSTIIIEAVEGCNVVDTVDDENATYVVRNVDEQISTLTAGDVFVYPYEQDNILIVKVETITVDGMTATITGSDLELEEVFSYMKIENTGSTEDMIVDENSGSEGVTYTGTTAPKTVTANAWADDAELQFTMGFEVGKEIDEYSSFSGTLGLKVDVELEYYISLQRQYMRLEYGSEVAVKIAYQFQADAPVPKATSKLELKSFGYSPITGVYLGFEPEVVVEFTATVEVSCTLRTSGGFSFEVGKGAKDLTRKPTLDIDIKFEGTIFFGIDLGPHISILKDAVAKVKLSALVGLEISGKTTGSAFEDIVIAGETSEEIHDCELCIEMEFGIKAELGLEIQFLKCKWLTFNPKLEAKRFKLGVCYYSETHQDFGWGECPYKLYRLTVTVTDDAGQKLSGAQVTAGGQTGNTNQYGAAVFYLAGGGYAVDATNGELSRTKNVQIDAAQKITITLSDTEDKENVFDNVGAQSSVDASMTSSGELAGNRYQLYDVSMTWPEAEEFCERLGGHLVTITSAEEQAFVESLMESGGKKQYWIGLRYRNGSYQWITDEAFSFSKWDVNQPDRHHYGDLHEDYVHILNQANPAHSTSKRFCWNDIYYDNCFYNANEEAFFSTCYVGLICEFESATAASAAENSSYAPQIISNSAYTGEENQSYGYVNTISPAGDSTQYANEREITPNAVYPGDYETEITDSYILKTASFTNLVPGEQYVMLAMVSIDAEDPLAYDNLLFVDQAQAFEDGTLVFTYVQRTPTELSYVVACGPSNKNLADAQITLPEMIASGEVQAIDPTVIYDGETLVEGTDYVVVGTVDFTAAGEYTCYIRGIHNYTGLVECVYTVWDLPVMTGKSFSLSFEDEILVNFYYAVSDLTNVVEHGMLVFNSDPGTVSYDSADVVYNEPVYDSAKDRYMATTTGIAAKEMGDTRYYVAYAKLTDGTYAYSATYDYSPKKYSMNMLGKDTTTDKQKALCVAMLNYGAAAQTYFGYNTDNLMNAELTAEQKALNIAYDASLFTGAVAADTNKIGNFAATSTGFSKKSATVSFEGAFCVNYYFTPSASVNGEMKLYIWTSDAYAAADTLTAENASTMTMVAGSDGSYWGQVTGIAAKSLDETYYVAGVYTDESGNTCCTGVIAYSLSRYCMSKAVDGNEMQELASATAMYGYYAKAYFA